MTLSRLVPRTTTTSAKSHLLPSNIHSWLHGLPVDEGQRGGGHLAPQALNGSVPSIAFHPLLCVQTYCVPGIRMEGPYNTQVTLCERTARSRRNSFGDSVREEVPLSCHSCKDLGKQAQPTDRSEDLLQPVLSPMDTPAKERGNALVTTACSELTVYPPKCCVD